MEYNTGIRSDNKLVTQGKLLKLQQVLLKNSYLLTELVDEVVNYSIALHAQKEQSLTLTEIYVRYCSKLPDCT